MKVFIKDEILSADHGAVCEVLGKEDIYFILKTKKRTRIEFHPSWLQEVPKELENESEETIKLYFAL